jgi:hypothetical protein
VTEGCQGAPGRWSGSDRYFQRLPSYKWYCVAQKYYLRDVVAGLDLLQEFARGRMSSYRHHQATAECDVLPARVILAKLVMANV